ncbi:MULTISPECIES: hypothetical protein [unclassified Paraburkholderia]|uniref:hypothetical protein n=1 Tax=unclassified Paraburkholderia TaxID=2615204 RepID=UPI0016125F09|nr:MULTISPECIES: hypothetical protein [unclassified Paraburkholderia]MBB5443255.1 hypothetical protein [Paraburkholderia sp. WSM4177]MBB5483139.1 hypothetical protein [Paraburkholderia sp. WSM4180]
MHPYKKLRVPRNRLERRAAKRIHAKALARAGKSQAQAAAAVSRLHADGYALMWYACACGHRERIWNSRDDVVPYMVPCPSCGRTSLAHVEFERDEVSKRYQPHEGQRVFVDMARDQAEQIIERAFARLGLNHDHPKFASSVDELLGHASSDSPLLAVAGDIAWYAPHTEAVE